jgi:cleavage and polyadenylation specificity factor subunit 2
MRAPKLVLAIPPSMSYGPSRWLFTSMASDGGNVIILTSTGEDGTFARSLYDQWQKDQQESAKWGGGKIGHVVDLQGDIELEVRSSM